MAEDRFLLDSPAIEKAVAFHNSADYPPRRPGKNFLDDAPAVGGGYDGMFAVTDNGDGTATIKGGWAQIGFAEVPKYIEDATVAYYYGYHLCLIARRDGVREAWKLSFVSVMLPGNVKDLYVPGTQMYFELAGPSETDDHASLVQYWQGGMIRFSDRYYVQ